MGRSPVGDEAGAGGRERPSAGGGGRMVVALALLVVIPTLGAGYLAAASGQLGLPPRVAALAVAAAVVLALVGYFAMRAVLVRLGGLADVDGGRGGSGGALEPAEESLADLARCFSQITDELQQTVRELESSRHRLRKSLYNVGRAMGSSQDLDSILQLILDVAIEMLDAEVGSLMLVDPSGEELTIRVARGLEERVVRTARIKVGEGVSGWVAKEGVPLLVPDIEADPRFDKRRTDRYKTDSLIAVPLIARGRTMGVININNKKSGEIFTREDLEILTTVASNAAVAIENAVLQESLEKTYLESVQALASAVEAKDGYTRGHSDRVTRYALMIGRRLGLSDAELATLEHAGALHDVGKIGIPDSILQKPGRLTEEEYALVKKHPALGEQIISPIRSLSHVARCVRHHHERWDGKGYPDGLAGEEIPLISRILAVADAYDAMTTNRPYRPAFPEHVARDMVRENAGAQFDPKLAELFLQILEEAEGGGGEAASPDASEAVEDVAV